MLKHRQSAQQILVEKQIPLFQNQMYKGLNAQPSSLPMVASFLPAKIKKTPNEKRLVIDVGGTNIRCAIAYFDDNGIPHIEQLRKTSIPTNNIGAKRFYTFIAEFVAPLCHCIDEIALCFSYNVNIDSTLDGQLVSLSKELDNPELVGTRVGNEILIALNNLGYNCKRITLSNDTVATLLGGLSVSNKEYSAYVGFIMGTGTNISYTERAINVKKVHKYNHDNMIINCESAEYSGFEMGDFDKIVIANTELPNQSQLEKMISGKYIAEIAYQALIFAKEENLITTACTITPFTAKDMTLFLSNEENIIDNMLMCDEDTAIAKGIMTEIINRSAKISAITVGATIIASYDKSHLPACVVCEGSTYRYLFGYKEQFHSYLTSILNKNGIEYDTIDDTIEYNLLGSLLSTFA